MYNKKISEPTNLMVMGQTDTTIDLHWNRALAEKNIQCYDLYRNNKRIKSINSTKIKDTGLLPGTLYHYSVVAIDIEGNESDMSHNIYIKTNKR